MISEWLLHSVRKHEGLRLEAYQDTEGVWTVGYGRNLQEMEIDLVTAEEWLYEDLMASYRDAQDFPEWERLDTQARRDVFVEMCFNMGANRLLGFKRMLAAIERQNWEAASHEMLDSKWSKQVGRRAETLAALMKYGEYTL